MCQSCWINAGSHSIVNDKTKEAAILIGNVDEFGNAHIVVSDWNMEDHNIDWCIKANEENENEINDEDVINTRLCLIALKQLTIEERYSAMAIYNNYIEA